MLIEPIQYFAFITDPEFGKLLMKIFIVSVSLTFVPLLTLMFIGVYWFARNNPKAKQSNKKERSIGLISMLGSLALIVFIMVGGFDAGRQILFYLSGSLLLVAGIANVVTKKGFTLTNAVLTCMGLATIVVTYILFVIGV